MMTFAAQYEILEPVTCGAVETFVARKVATDERVLVYIFECRHPQGNRPTVQWIMESFRALAPDPPAVVTETGRYESTAYGYMVTRSPETPVLQAWIQSYEARQHAPFGAVPVPVSTPARGVPGSVKPDPNDIPPSERPTGIFSPEASEEITAAFEALRSELRPSSPAPVSSAKPVDQAAPTTISTGFLTKDFAAPEPVDPDAPGDFTRQFSSEFEGKRIDTAIHSAVRLPEAFQEITTPDAGLPAKNAAPPKRAVEVTETPSAIFRKLVFAPLESADPSSPEPPIQATAVSPARPFATEPHVKSEPSNAGDFTRQFAAEFQGKRIDTAIHSEALLPEELHGQTVRDPIPTAKTASEPKRPEEISDNPSAIFQKLMFAPLDSAEPPIQSTSASPARPFATEPAEKSGSSNAGDFSSFFRGPFDGQRPADTPDLSARAAREKQEAGDFTRVFGASKPEPAGDFSAPPTVTRNPAASPETPSFTSVFNSTEMARRTSAPQESAAPYRDTFEPDRSGFSAVREQPSPTPSRPLRTPADFVSPQVSSAASREPEMPFASHSEPEGATRVFTVPQRAPEPDLSSLPAGPSEYTRIINMGPRKPSAPEDLPGTARPQGPPAGGAPLPAGVPAIPPAPVFPQYQAPAIPPPMPPPSPIASFPPPQVPQLGGAAPKAGGPPWTLILILNGLFIVAVVLVLYFALRH